MDRRLNVKKVIIAILILLLLIVSIVVFSISRMSINPENNIGNKEQIDNATTDVFTDIEDTISIEIPKKYKMVQSHNNEYLIKLSSEEHVDVYISTIDKIEGRNLFSMARADKLAYLESYNSYSNASELKELEVNGNKAYMYSFHYLDENLNKAFYIQVILLEIGEKIYIFDIDFPLQDLVLYTNLATETLSTFKVL